MDSELDEAKREANILKHGIDFVAAVKIFDGPFIESKDRRRDYGEERYQAIGKLDGRINPDRLHLARRTATDHQREKGRAE